MRGSSRANYIRQWKLTPFMRVQHKLQSIEQIVQRSATRLLVTGGGGGGGKSAPPPLTLATLALCQHVVRSVHWQINTSSGGASGDATSRSIQAIFAQLALLLNSLGESGSPAVFASVCDFFCTILTSRQPFPQLQRGRRQRRRRRQLVDPNGSRSSSNRDAVLFYVLQQNIQCCLTGRFIARVVAEAMLASHHHSQTAQTVAVRVAARSSACALLAKLVRMPSLWQAYVQQKVVAESGLNTQCAPGRMGGGGVGGNAAAADDDETENNKKGGGEQAAFFLFVDALVTAPPPSSWNAPATRRLPLDLMLFHGDQLLQVATEPRLALREEGWEVVLAARRTCRFLIERALDANDGDDDDDDDDDNGDREQRRLVVATFLQQVRTRCASQVENAAATAAFSVRFSLLPQVCSALLLRRARRAAKGSSGSTDFAGAHNHNSFDDDLLFDSDKSQRAGFSLSLSDAIRTCLTNLLCMFRTQPWKLISKPRVAAVEQEHWATLQQLLNAYAARRTAAGHTESAGSGGGGGGGGASSGDLAADVGPALVKQFIARALRRRYGFKFVASPLNNAPRPGGGASSQSAFFVVQTLCAVEGVVRRDYKDVIVLLVSHPQFIATLSASRGNGGSGDDRPEPQQRHGSGDDGGRDSDGDCGGGGGGGGDSSDNDGDLALLELLQFLFPHCPSLLKQRSRLVYVLLAAYGATLSLRDQMLLQLIELFEAHGCEHRAATLGFRWGAAALTVDQVAEADQQSDDASASTTGAGAAAALSGAGVDSDWFFTTWLDRGVDNDGNSSHNHAVEDGVVDPVRLFWTQFSFPRRRVCPLELGSRLDSTGAIDLRVIGSLESGGVGGSGASGGANNNSTLLAHRMYDPRFFLRLLLHYARCTTLPLRRFFKMGCFALVLFATTSDSLATRQLAYEVIALVGDQLEAAKFAEVMQLRHLVVGLLRRSIPAAYAQLPGLVCAFFAECCQVLLDPASHLYGNLNQFLLARPHLDLSDVPMFYASFQAATPDAREVRQGVCVWWLCVVGG